MRSPKMFAISLLVLLGACTEPPSEDITCNAWVRDSAQITVLGVDGAQTTEATVTYTKDAAPQPCDVAGDIYFCGVGVAGDLTIEAVGVDASATEIVTVPEDECGVETQKITMQLQGNI